VTKVTKMHGSFFLSFVLVSNGSAARAGPRRTGTHEMIEKRDLSGQSGGRKNRGGNRIIRREFVPERQC
jgi:hypothetical protein